MQASIVPMSDVYIWRDIAENLLLKYSSVQVAVIGVELLKPIKSEEQITMIKAIANCHETALKMKVDMIRCFGNILLSIELLTLESIINT
jgi:hypothetical protein